MSPDLLIGLAAVGIVVSLVQAVKPFVKDERFYPLIAIGLGILWNVAATAATQGVNGTNVPEAILLGVLSGLAASGLYTGQKVIRPGRKIRG